MRKGWRIDQGNFLRKLTTAVCNSPSPPSERLRNLIKSAIELFWRNFSGDAESSSDKVDGGLTEKEEEEVRRGEKKRKEELGLRRESLKDLGKKEIDSEEEDDVEGRGERIEREWATIVDDSEYYKKKEWFKGERILLLVWFSFFSVFYILFGSYIFLKYLLLKYSFSFIENRC